MVAGTRGRSERPTDPKPAAPSAEPFVVPRDGRGRGEPRSVWRSVDSFCVLLSVLVASRHLRLPIVIMVQAVRTGIAKNVYTRNDFLLGEAF
jgi:hypothetical protein